jgi:hypothetical protein
MTIIYEYKIDGHLFKLFELRRWCLKLNVVHSRLKCELREA